ncbi:MULTISPECIES: hypothetical protein [Xanthomonas]|uniref:hypothetical protein n=1 Tax=Xanthomonas cannabis TaxID=1885674 RepID=UPI00161E278E|nr:hypothetical protein [Xanthomonas cannabis]
MTTSETRRMTTLLTQQEHFSFGVTVEQIDRFHTLLRTITAQSDMVAVCSGQALDNGSVSILGESIFNAARALRGIVDEIDAQPLCGEHQRLR